MEFEILFISMMLLWWCDLSRISKFYYSKYPGL